MQSSVIVYALLAVVVMVLSSSVHEWAHAFVATKLGDDTPQRDGRVTLNPSAHIDVVGTLVMPAVGALLGGMLIGWARPVAFRPSRFKRSVTMRRGIMYVALAGPLSNLALFGGCLVLLKVLTIAVGGAAGWTANGTLQAFGQLLVVGIHVNLVLFFFNMIPAPPLDGFRVLEGLMPPNSKLISLMNEYQMLAFLGAILIGMRVLVVPLTATIRGSLELFDLLGVYGALLP